MLESVTRAGVPRRAVTLLWSVQNEGLATYVAYRAKPAGLVLDDYRLIENEEEVRKRFELCRGG